MVEVGKRSPDNPLVLNSTAALLDPDPPCLTAPDPAVLTERYSCTLAQMAPKRILLRGIRSVQITG